MLASLEARFQRLSHVEIVAACLHHSRSQLYEWRRSLDMERKAREKTPLDEAVIANAAGVIAAFPHLSGSKGQAVMLYHGLGYIGQKAYDRLKKQVKRVLSQEVSGRKDLPACRDKYEHIKPEGIRQIWAEDFTEIVLEGESLKLAVLIDVFSQYILGWALARQATESLVAIPVIKALASNGGKPPEQFLLCDNGKQYVSEEHNRLLAAHEIVGRHIPAYRPQYNGAVECGGKEFKNVFYNVWERREREGADKGKNLIARAQQAGAETVRLLNEEIPRPALGGVTPADVQQGKKQERLAEIARYRKQEIAKESPPPLSRPFWDVLKDGVKAEVMTTKELLTKLAFYGMRPLRRVAQLNREVWGN